MVQQKGGDYVKLNQVTEDVLKVIDSYGFKQEGAYNLRLNGMAVCHGDSRHIAIVKKPTFRASISESAVKHRMNRCIFLLLCPNPVLMLFTTISM